MASAHEQYQGLRIVEQSGQKTQLIAPHNGGELTFLHPAYGPGTYANVGLSIEQDNLKRPTMAEIASLVHAAFNSPEDNRYIKEIKDIMRNEWLWAFTGTLYVLKEGAFIENDPEIRDGMPFMDLEDLTQKLYSMRDPSVRFVPFGYNVGEMSPSELSKNAYVIALVGEEVAEKLARVAGKHVHKPRLWSYEHVDENKTRVSALGSWAGGQRLDVVGSVFGGSDGRAFGYLKGLKNSRAKK